MNDRKNKKTLYKCSHPNVPVLQKIKELTNQTETKVFEILKTWLYKETS